MAETTTTASRRGTSLPSLALVSGAALASGCLLVTDLDVRQCRKDGDCAKLGAQYIDYLCRDQVCEPFRCERDEECTSKTGLEGSSCVDGACIQPECTKDADCSSESPTSSCSDGQCVDPQWGCLRDRADKSEAKPSITFGAQILDFYSRKPPRNTKAFVCRLADPTCETPTAGPYVPDADGFVSFVIGDVPPTGFDGYVRFTADDELPLEYQFTTPAKSDFIATAATPFTMLPPGALTALGSFAGVEVDEESSAVLAARLYDCNGDRAAGLRLTAKPSTDAVFYASDQNYVATANAEQTDDYGTGGLINLSPGVQTISVVHVASNSTLFEFRMPVRPKTFILSFVSAQDR